MNIRYRITQRIGEPHGEESDPIGKGWMVGRQGQAGVGDEEDNANRLRRVFTSEVTCRVLSK